MRALPRQQAYLHVRRFLTIAAAVASVFLFAQPAAASAPVGLPAGLKPPISQTKPPPNFWRSAREVVAIGDRQPDVRRLRAHEPALHGQAYAGDLGLWIVLYRDRRGIRARIPIEDRTGDVLEPSLASYPLTSGDANAATVKVELICLALAIFSLAVLFDFRRPFRVRNLDLLALLSLGAAVALFHHDKPLIGVPLIYPPLLYLCVRFALVGFRGAGDEGPLAARGGTRFLIGGLVGLVAARIVVNLILGGVGDIGYASVYGASNIHEGWPLYVADHNHLDTYGPITYLAYLPFELVFPLHSLRHDYLPAAHAAAIAFDLLSIAGLTVLGRRLRPGESGRRLGLVLAFAWAASPFTFLNLMANTNDGLVPLFVIWALVAISSPVRRGLLLGLGAAAKFAPLALAGLFATANGDRRRRSALFCLAMAAATAIPILIYAKPGGLGVFWSQTLGFQFHRHSFLSIWGQYPQLEPLKLAVQAGAVGLALAASLPSRRRTTAQVGTLAGAILIALQLSAAHWYFFYIAWFMPGVLLALFALEPRAEGQAEPDEGALDALDGWTPAFRRPAAAPASPRAALS